MAFTLVRSKFAASGDTNSVTTAAADFTGVDLLVLLAVSYQAATAPSVSDSQSNASWTGLTLQETAGSARARLFYHKNPSVSAAQTYSLTGTGTYCAIGVLGFSGSDTTNQYDSPHQNGAAMSGIGSVQPGSVTPSVASALLVTGIGWQGSNTMTIGSSFNLVTGQIDFNSGVNFGIALAWKETSGAENPLWSGTNMTGGVVLASFLPSGGGGGGGIVVPVVEAGYRRRRV